MKEKCDHGKYKKVQIGQKWTGHSVCLVEVRRTCELCRYSQDNWELGNHEQHPRMFADDVNFFTNRPFAGCNHKNATKTPIGVSVRSHSGPFVCYKWNCPDCGEEGENVEKYQEDF